MKTQRTPGPWTATINRYPDGLYNGRPYVSSAYGCIAQTFMAEAGEANARLLAAAPDLAEALHDLIQCRDGTFATSDARWAKAKGPA